MNAQDTDWYVGLAWEPERLDPDLLSDVLLRWEQQARRRRLPAADLMRPGLLVSCASSSLNKSSE